MRRYLCHADLLRHLVTIVGLMVALKPMPAAAAPYAYVTNLYANTVAVIDVSSATVVATVPVPVGPGAEPGDTGPVHLAITPDGAYVYVPLSGSPGLNSVAVISTALALTNPTNAVVALVPVGEDPQGVAITPDGAHAYVANLLSNSVSVIDTALALTDPTHAVVATVLVRAGSGPYWVAISPDGQHAWVTEAGDVEVAVIDTGLALSSPGSALVAEVPVGIIIPAGARHPWAVAISQDGSRAYVSSRCNLLSSCGLAVIDTASLATSFVALEPLGRGDSYGVAITPDGTHVYVTRGGAGNLVEVVDTATLRLVRSIPVGINPFGVAVTPDGTQAYVTNINDSTVSVINVALNTVVGDPISVGTGAGAFGVAMTPGFTAVSRLGVTALAGVGIDLMVASDPARVRSVTWDFLGNGSIVQTTSTLTTRFTYPTPGVFVPKVTVVFSDGSRISEAIPLHIQSSAQAISTTRTLTKLLHALNAGQQNSLIRKLDAASDSLQRGDVTPSCNQIGAFRNELNALVQSGRLAANSAAPALGEGQAIQISLACR